MTIRVLHIDDDKLFLRLTSDLVRDEATDRGDEIEITGIRGLEGFKSEYQPDTYDCIVCDYKIGANTGRDVLQEVNCTETPIIFYTRKRPEKVRELTDESVVSAYVQKDSEKDAFRTLVDEMIAASESQ